MRRNEPAERINLAVVFGQSDVMSGQDHWFFLGPMVGRRIVFVDQADGRPYRRGYQACKHIKLAVGRNAKNLLVRFRKWSQLGPFSLRKGGGSGRNQEQSQPDYAQSS